LLLASLERAAALYQGDLLAGMVVDEAPFEEWLLAERERLRELALEGLVKLLVHQRNAGAGEGAIRTALRASALDPLHESVHRTLMRLFVQSGRRGAALRQYQICVGVLQRELGVEPESETKRLYRSILQRRDVEPVEEDAPLPISAGGRAHRNGSPSTRGRTAGQSLPELLLIGRDVELARLQSALNETEEGRGQVVVLIEAGIQPCLLSRQSATHRLSTRAKERAGPPSGRSARLRSERGPWARSGFSGLSAN
jgi:transcriptional activator